MFGIEIKEYVERSIKTMENIETALIKTNDLLTKILEKLPEPKKKSKN